MHELDPQSCAIHSFPQWERSSHSFAFTVTWPCLYFSTYFTLPCRMISGVRVHFSNQNPRSQVQECYSPQHLVQSLACGEYSKSLCQNKGPESCGSLLSDFGNREDHAHTKPEEKQQIFNAMWGTQESKGKLQGRQKRNRKGTAR